MGSCSVGEMSFVKGKMRKLLSSSPSQLILVTGFVKTDNFMHNALFTEELP